MRHRMIQQISNFGSVPWSQQAALSDALWGRIGACILTSATLAHHGEFVIPAGTLGLPVNSGLVVAGAFHYQTQGRLVISRFAGDPRDDRAHMRSGLPII